MPHIPLYVPDDVHDPNPANAYTCVIEHIDAEVGRLADTVRDLGLAEKTYIIYTSDNGPWLQFKNHGGSAHPLRDGKATTFEGGQRVPYPEIVARLKARLTEIDAEITANARPVWGTPKP